jgi:ubiquinone/menaquinone biosynthesis C-methylase UbiE
MNFIHLVFNAIKLTDKVLDVGGARQPFRRADFVIDIVPYEMRDIENSFLLELPEHFSKNSWICQNICDENKGLPFKDKEFDFAICGHVLEDIANPFYVIKELQRVAKRGYIEVPSRFYEQYPRFHKNRLCGDPHHRWIIDLRFNPDSNENELIGSCPGARPPAGKIRCVK